MASGVRGDERVTDAANQRNWPTNPYDEWTVERALKLARAIRNQWDDIPDEKGRIPGVQFFALITLAAEVERLRAAEEGK